MLHYDNWHRPTDQDLEFEWETEWDKLRYYLDTDFFDDRENFVDACQKGRVVRLTRHGDDHVERRTYCDSIQELEDTVSTYRSAERRKGMPTKLAEMMQNNMALPTPILFRYRGSVYCVGGNTRLDVARILQVSPDPQVLLVDLDAMGLALKSLPRVA